MNKLEEIIETKKKTEKDKQADNLKKISKQEETERKKKNKLFRKNFNLIFSKFKKLVKIKFDKYHDCHAVFYYKKAKFSIAFEKWKHEAYGVDGYDTSGEKWALHKWTGGWQGEGHTIVDITNIKPDKDYSDKVIDLLSELVKQ